MNIDEDGYEAVRRRRPRTLAQYVPEIFAVDDEKCGDSVTKELSKKRVSGDSCLEKLCDFRSCEEIVVLKGNCFAIVAAESEPTFRRRV